MMVVFEIEKRICLSWCRSDGFSRIRNLPFGDHVHSAEIRHVFVNHGTCVYASK